MSSPTFTLSQAAFGRDQSQLVKAMLVAAGSLLLWASAKVQIPFYPVPLTMQTFAVLVVGAALGWRMAMATVALYLLEGAAGLPVFAGTPEKGIGLAYMAGPTGGYLFGYLLAAPAVGWLAERGWDRHAITTAIAMLAGNLLIYVPGLLWLGSVVGWDKPVLAWGLTPFLLGDLTKLALAAAVLPASWMLIGGKRQ
jgi:biotin transport system substrate-specific component